MVGRLEAGIDDRGEGVGLSLEGSSAATLDRVRPLGEVAEITVVIHHENGARHRGQHDTGPGARG